MLAAHKLTGNFHINLEIILKNLGAFDDVTFKIEPKSQRVVHRDCRCVAFRPNKNVDMDRFSEIMRSIKGGIGFDAAQSWWARVFSSAQHGSADFRGVLITAGGHPEPADGVIDRLVPALCQRAFRHPGDLYTALMRACRLPSRIHMR